MENFFDFINENPTVKRLQVNDLLFAEYQCPLSEYRYDIWSHHNYFIYVISGKKKWFTRNQEVLARQGDCLFVRKGGHSVYQYFDSEFCALVLFVPDTFIRSVLLDNQIKTGKPDDYTSGHSLFSIKADNQLRAYFHSFLSYLSASDKPEEKLMELKFRELIMLTATGTADKSLRGYFAGICESTNVSLRDVMEANYIYPMNLEEYARLSRRSLSTFKRDFRKIYNTSPGKWLVQKRLDLAKYLLENTGKSVTDISHECGFVNNSHFNRIFKENFGMTPLECSKNRVQQEI